jgi:hypothetical protein
VGGPYHWAGEYWQDDYPARDLFTSLCVHFNWQCKVELQTAPIPVQNPREDDDDDSAEGTTKMM